ncbi:MAG: copper resistance protein CopC [Proteobacteria bacterium]|nr:copper resistance protein CopC [Pseudomonadota bacterium]
MRTLALVISLLALACATAASAHAFPDNSSPHVGATIATVPKMVKVWFDGELEPVFSTLVVKNAAGAVVSLGKGEVDAKNQALLETTLPKGLPPGTYTVYWSVVARDGHRTAGHFTFTVK